MLVELGSHLRVAGKLGDIGASVGEELGVLLDGMVGLAMSRAPEGYRGT